MTSPPWIAMSDVRISTSPSAASWTAGRGAPDGHPRSGGSPSGRLDRIASSQLDFLTGVSDFYLGRTDTRMTIAAERLAVIAAVTLPITALSGIMGMNVIVNAESDYGGIGIILLVMVVMSGVLLRSAKRQGWW